MKIEEMISANRADCSGCEACANICPKNAITMIRDAEGFAYPQIDPELCIKCGRCDATCPALNYTKKAVTNLSPAFIAIYDNDKILRNSSSGGAFTALSEIILKEGGVVFGAAYDKFWHVRHDSAKTLEELEKLRSSKYVQSQIGDVYRQAKKFLDSGVKVLFSGTPCHCAALKHFLGKDYENLLTVEVICHGVPSPALWESYIDEVGYAHKITGVNFRSKRNIWGGTGTSYLDIIFADRGHIISANSNNPYGRLFLRNLSLRPSCGSCKFRFPNMQSDLSLGDAWGIKDFAPERFDNRGVSVVFIHTAKGKEFFERANLNPQPVRFAEAVNKNRLFIAPTTFDSRREKFFAELAKSNDWYDVIQKYYAQDSEEIRKDTGKRSGAAFWKSLREILTPIRQQFAQSVLVIASVRKRDEQKVLSKFFEQNLKDCNVFFLQPKGDGQFVCSENFSGFKSDLKDVAALTDFVKKYDLKAIFVEKPLKFGKAFASTADWIKSSGLPVRFFAQKTK